MPATLVVSGRASRAHAWHYRGTLYIPSSDGLTVIQDHLIIGLVTTATDVPPATTADIAHYESLGRTDLQHQPYRLFTYRTGNLWCAFRSDSLPLDSVDADVSHSLWCVFINDEASTVFAAVAGPFVIGP